MLSLIIILKPVIKQLELKNWMNQKVKTWTEFKVNNIKSAYLSFLVWRIIKNDINVIKLTYGMLTGLLIIENKMFKIFILFGILFLFMIKLIDTKSTQLHDKLEIQKEIFMINGYKFGEFIKWDYFVITLNYLYVMYEFQTINLIESLIRISFMSYVIFHDCPKAATISSTFRQKGDSVIMIIFCLLIGFMRGELIALSFLRSFIFIYGTNDGVGANIHIFWTFIYGIINQSDKLCFLLFVLTSEYLRYRLRIFENLYRDICKNSYSMNQFGSLKLFKNLPLYLDAPIWILSDLNFINELLLL